MSGLNIFGVRHLSPTGAHALVRYLDEVKPKLVLIEGPSDASHLIEHIVDKKSIPPLAILAYTTERPIRSLLDPYSVYSPEYQAMLWAHKHGADCRFIDLPSSTMLKLKIITRDLEKPTDEEFYAETGEYYAKLLSSSGDMSYEDFWEKYFEHDTAEYRASLLEYGSKIRQFGREPRDAAENFLRESYMRTQIASALAEGYAPEETAVITGAYHCDGLNLDLPHMSDEEIKNLPTVDSKLTLMPYTYLMLSSRTGYGAGNRAPRYFDLIWENIDNRSQVPSIFFTNIAASIRKDGTSKSTAEVMDAVMLAESMATCGGYKYPTLNDLRAAAVTCLGGGEAAVVNKALTELEHGSVVGSLPVGVSQTSLQDDFNLELERLKLTSYKTDTARTLILDIRENRRAQSEESAFLDLSRSQFLNRLWQLEIQFAAREQLKERAGNWAENWTLVWLPQIEIQLVEASLIGETVELACIYKFRDEIEKCEDIEELSTILQTSFLCALPQVSELAINKLQTLSLDSLSFIKLVTSMNRLSLIIGYSTARKVDSKSVEPLFTEMFVHASLIISTAAKCSDDIAQDTNKALADLNSLEQLHYQLVNGKMFLDALREIALRDNFNPKVSGYACAILLERGQITDDELNSQLSLRLSPGMPSDLGAYWFEGLAARNRYALLSRVKLWEGLASYIDSLGDNEFGKAVVFLRRTFGTFSASDKAAIVDILCNVWGIKDESFKQQLIEDLSDEELKKIEAMNDIDFDNI